MILALSPPFLHLGNFTHHHSATSPSSFWVAPTCQNALTFCQIDVAPTPACHVGLRLCHLLLVIVFWVPSLIFPFWHHWQPSLGADCWRDVRLGHVLVCASGLEIISLQKVGTASHSSFLSLPPPEAVILAHLVVDWPIFPFLIQIGKAGIVPFVTWNTGHQVGT